MVKKCSSFSDLIITVWWYISAISAEMKLCHEWSTRCLFIFRLHTHNTCTLTPTNARAFSKIESANSRDWQSHHYAPQNLISGLSLSCRVLETLETCKSKANSFGGYSPAAGAWWWRALLFNAHMVCSANASSRRLSSPAGAGETLISFSLFISLST